MPVLFSRPALRWLLPAAVTVAVIGGGVAIGAVTSAADPTLPPRTAAQLLVDLQTAQLDGLSGTIVANSDLGLPALPTGGGDSTDLSSLLAGTHTLRVWYSGPSQARVALLGTLGETDVIANGTDLWTWSSRANTATHRTIPAGGSHSGRPTGLPTGLPTALPSGSLTPQSLADLALAAISPSTEVTTQNTDSIAGRNAYELVLTPRDPQSLIGSVRLAVDAVAHVPLRVQVFARGSGSPSIEVAFTQVNFTRPDPAEFTFNPPPGANVVQGDSETPGGKPATGAAPKTAVIGKGWTSVVVARIPQLTGDADLQPILHALPAVSGAWGSGHLLSGKLFSALLTDDGRVLVGAVGPDRLYAAAVDPAAKLTS